MKVRIDHDECIACGACYADCPEFFEENEDGMSIVLEAYRDGDPAAGEGPGRGKIKAVDG
jgi:ferredoxin